MAGYDVVCILSNGKCQEPTTGAAVPLTNLSSSSVQYYWVDGADNRQVQYTVTIRGRQYSKAATFNVKRPTAQITTGTGDIQLTTMPDGYGLWFGSQFTPGIHFSANVTMPSGFNGDLQWVQIWNKSRRVLGAVSNRWSRSQGTGIDERYPYESGSAANDVPGIAFSETFKATTINDSHQMWLMFKPSGLSQPTIWVPLKVTNWGWTADASFNGSFWVLNSSSKSPVTTADTTSFPSWSRNAENIGYVFEQ